MIWHKNKFRLFIKHIHEKNPEAWLISKKYWKEGITLSEMLNNFHEYFDYDVIEWVDNKNAIPWTKYMKDVEGLVLSNLWFRIAEDAILDQINSGLDTWAIKIFVIKILEIDKVIAHNYWWFQREQVSDWKYWEEVFYSYMASAHLKFPWIWKRILLHTIDKIKEYWCSKMIWDANPVWPESLLYLQWWARCSSVLIRDKKRTDRIGYFWWEIAYRYLFEITQKDLFIDKAKTPVQDNTFPPESSIEKFNEHYKKCVKNSSIWLIMPIIDEKFYELFEKNDKETLSYMSDILKKIIDSTKFLFEKGYVARWAGLYWKDFEWRIKWRHYWRIIFEKIKE